MKVTYKALQNVFPPKPAPLASSPVQDILSLVFVCARINHPFITPAHSHYPHYFNTIARLLRHI